MATASHLRPIKDLYSILPISRNSKSIRVIDVHGVVTTCPSHESLTASIRVINLDYLPLSRYATLSYVWGSQIDRNSPTITLNHGSTTSELHLTRNCHQALLDLRSNLGSFTIWVDAICIDQTSDWEMTDQLNQMGYIYSKSETTYVWLGPYARSSQKLVANLKSVGFLEHFFDLRKGVYNRLIRPRPWSALLSTWYQTVRYAFSYAQHLMKVASSCAKSTFRRSLPAPKESNTVRVSHLGEEWLSRIWTYQEIMLANQPIIVWGDTLINWHVFAMALCCVVNKPGTRSSRRLKQQLGPTFDLWWTLILDRLNFVYKMNSAFHKDRELPPCGYKYPVFYTKFRAYRLTVSIIFLWLITGLLMTLSLCPPNSLRGFYLDLDSPNRATSLLTWSLYFLLGIALVIAGINLKRFLSPRPTEVPPTPVHLLEAIWSRKCAVSRDYNFAVRSVLQCHLSRKLPILDYAESESRVFQDLTTHVLEAFGCWEILKAAIASSSREGQPSWFVDWTQNRIRSVPLLSRYKTFPAYAKRLDIRFDLLRPHILGLRGSEIGTVTSIIRFTRTAGAYCDLDNSENLQVIIGILRMSSRILRCFQRGCGDLTNDTSRMGDVIRYISQATQDSPRSILDQLNLMEKDPLQLLLPLEGLDYKTALAQGIDCFIDSRCYLFTTTSPCSGCPERLWIARDIDNVGEKCNIITGDKVVQLIGMPECAVLRHDSQSSSNFESTACYKLVNTCDRFGDLDEAIDVCSECSVEKEKWPFFDLS